jgi:hypothetical protein
MMATGEWERWEASWRSARSTAAEMDAMIARTRRAWRAIVFVRVLSLAVAATALAVVGAALRHAGNPIEAALGMVVGLGIAGAWLVDALNQRRAAEKVEALAEEYLAARRVFCVRAIGLARLGWIVVALDLVFLVPWWVGGLRVHGLGLSQVLTVWAPLALMVAFVAWTLRVRSRARAELGRLKHVEETMLQE